MRGRRRDTPLQAPALERLHDVAAADRTDGDGLVWSESAAAWVPAAPATDADTVDGKHAADFALSTHNHDDVYAAIDHDHDGAYLAIDGTAANASALETHPAADFALAGHDHDEAYLAIDGQAADSAQLEGHAAADFAASDHGHALVNLTDVDPTDLADGDLLQWDATAGKWVRLAPGASGSFTSQDGKAITVVGGRITAIV